MDRRENCGPLHDEMLIRTRHCKSLRVLAGPPLSGDPVGAHIQEWYGSAMIRCTNRIVDVGPNNKALFPSADPMLDGDDVTRLK